MNLQLFAEQSLEKFSLSGISLAWHGKHTETATAGFADRDHRTALSPHSQFLIYSITKIFIAALVIQQCERGTVSFSSLLTEWLPDIPNAGRITVQHLLNHTSGLPDYGALSKYHDDVKQHPLQPWSEQEFLDNTLQQGVLFEPGNGWHYSNIGYMLLVHILEKITGQRFKETLTEQVLEPLHLEHSFVPTAPEDLHSLTPGYSKYLSKDDSVLVDVRFNYHPGWVSHKVIASTPADVAKFLYALFQGRIIGQASLEQMTKPVSVPHRHPRFKNPGYGLGLMSDPNGDYGTLYGHGGEGPGYSVAAFYNLNPGPAAISVFSETENAGAVEQTACDAFKISQQ